MGGHVSWVAEFHDKDIERPFVGYKLVVEIFSFDFVLGLNE